jgi:hypothetical protein
LGRIFRPFLGDGDPGEDGALHHDGVGLSENDGLRREALAREVVERPPGRDAALRGREEEDLAGDVLARDGVAGTGNLSRRSWRRSRCRCRPRRRARRGEAGRRPGS